MFNDEESAHVVQLLDDLRTDLLNGNEPAAKLLVISLTSLLLIKQPLEWGMLGSFINDHLNDAAFRIALMRLLPDIKELICPLQPDQKAGFEC